MDVSGSIEWKEGIGWMEGLLLHHFTSEYQHLGGCKLQMEVG
jgi:hypothetical protein